VAAKFAETVAAFDLVLDALGMPPVSRSLHLPPSFSFRRGSGHGRLVLGRGERAFFAFR